MSKLSLAENLKFLAASPKVTNASDFESDVKKLLSTIKKQEEVFISSVIKEFVKSPIFTSLPPIKQDSIESGLHSIEGTISEPINKVIERIRKLSN